MPAPEKIRITLAQCNPVAGDIAGNTARAQAALSAGEAAGADLVVLPEMFLSGYQLLDLSVRPAFLRDVQAALEVLAAATRPAGCQSARRQRRPASTMTGDSISSGSR